MLKEIDFPCMQCSHVGVCRYDKDMKQLDEQLMQIEIESPYAKVKVVCDKFENKEMFLKK